MRATDQVVAVANGMGAEEFDIGRGEFGETAHGAGHVVVVHEGKQLRSEQLRQQDELRAVIGRRVEDEIDLADKAVPVIDMPQLVLNRGDTNLHGKSLPGS